MPEHFQNIDKPWRVLRVGLWVGIVVDLLCAVLYLYYYVVDVVESTPNPDLEGLGQTYLDLFSLILVAFNGAILLLWMYRAYANLKMMPTPTMRQSPLVAALSWIIIPHHFFVAPYRTIKEIFFASNSENRKKNSDYSTLPAPFWFDCWWTSWLLRLFLSSSQDWNFSREHLTALVCCPELFMGLSKVFGIIASFLLLRILSETVKNQKALSHSEVA